MRPVFRPELVNGDTGDPALFVDFQFMDSAILIDLGDLAFLPPRKMLRLSSVFVSHTHMDHFIGFDRLLRILLGREKTVSLFGPPGFIAQVGAKLSGYTWNLVENYSANLVLIANELSPGGHCETARFESRKKFLPEGLGCSAVRQGILLDEAFFRVRFDFLDHDIPCLAFAVEEKEHANIWKNRLDELGLSKGSWLREFREAVLRREPDDKVFDVCGRKMRLGELWAAVRIVPGQRISYVTDAVYDSANIEKIVNLADCSDTLFIEAMFLQQDHLHARSRRHLTARQAGEIGRMARAKAIVPFHFSPRYSGREELLRREALVAFSP